MNNILWPNIFMTVIATLISTFLISFFFNTFSRKIFSIV